jgi:diguanylate cyclase (GGDEF)-like protein
VTRDEKNATLPPAAPAGTSDAELTLAALEVSRLLELHQQLDVLVRRAEAWCASPRVFALGPGEERTHWSPIVSNVPRDDAALSCLGNVDPQRLRAALGDGPAAFDGLGPLEVEARTWNGPRPASCAALPVQGDGDDWAAVLLLLFAEPADSSRLDRLGQLLRMTRPAVANALRVAGMRELVIKDDTAHCFNRRYFESCLPEELARASRFHAPLSLIFLDMDNLKEVNSRYGHAMGSQSLREVSGRVRVKIRRFDKLFRFGGDEFCIVLPETEWPGALEVAERVRDAIAGKPFLARELGGTGVPMTASLGIASFPLHARTKQELIEQADRAMQRIKGGTKNSIGIAEIHGGDHGG